MSQGISRSPLWLLLLKLVRFQKAWGSVPCGESHCQISSLMLFPYQSWLGICSCINNQETRMLTSLHSLNSSALKERAKSTSWCRMLAQTRPSCQGLALSAQRVRNAKELLDNDRTMKDRHTQYTSTTSPPENGGPRAGACAGVKASSDHLEGSRSLVQFLMFPSKG